jgi:hypothetical protein
MAQFEWKAQQDTRARHLRRSPAFEFPIQWVIKVPTYLDVLKYIFTGGKRGSTYEIVEYVEPPINRRCSIVSIETNKG